MCAEQHHRNMRDSLESRLQSSVGDRPTVTDEEHLSLMAAVRESGQATGIRCRSLEFSSPLSVRLGIAAGLLICGLLTALFVVSRPAAHLSEGGGVAPVAETLAVAEALPQYAQMAALQLEAIPTDEWNRIQQDGEAAYGHVMRCITQFGG